VAVVLHSSVTVRPQRCSNPVWSPDGSKLLGGRGEGYSSGFGVYRVCLREYRLAGAGRRATGLAERQPKVAVRRPGRAEADGQPVEEVREVLNATPNTIGILSVSRDNRNIYLGLSVSEADIWLMSLR
jgi:hypothetical protein